MNEFKFRNECFKNLGYAIDLKNIPPIGKISRFKDKTKKNHNLDGWIANINNNIYKIGSWSNNITFCYIDNNFTFEKVNPEEKKILRNKYKEATFLAEKERENRYFLAAQKAETELNSMQNCNNHNDHDYLRIKFISPSFGMKKKGNKIYIPIFNSYTGKLQSYQSIDNKGNKLFLKEGKKTNGCFPINNNEDFDTIILCEGLATGATIYRYHQSLEFMNKYYERPYDETKPLVLCCFDAGNLIKVAQSMRSKYLDMVIEIWADNDANKIGLSKARDVKKSVSNIKIYYPNFTQEDINNGLSDYNDLVEFKRD